jgi:Protein of unknown function (DUF1566)
VCSSKLLWRYEICALSRCLAIVCSARRAVIVERVNCVNGERLLPTVTDAYFTVSRRLRPSVFSFYAQSMRLNSAMTIVLATARLVAACLLLVNVAHAQTKPLNDTGQTQCYNASDVAGPCDATTTGNTGARPHQDGRYGRDAKAGATPALTKIGGGAAGFDFSCVLWDGTVINSPTCATTLVANTTDTPSATPATDWACTRDNVTGLIWSLQTLGPTDWNAATDVAYADAGHNTSTPPRCGAVGAGTVWRLPTRREMLSIMHFGVNTAPTIDTAYFPSTVANWHWTANTYASLLEDAWFVDFNSGGTGTLGKTNSRLVRLVRSGQ